MAQEVNVEQIMSQIREEIKEKGLTKDMLSFDDVIRYKQYELRSF